MLILKAYLTIVPAFRGEFLQHIVEFVAVSRAESGCLSFGCYEDISAANTFMVLEAWQSEAALHQHEQSPHVAAFKAKIRDMIAARQPSQIYTVSDVSTLNQSKG